MDYIFLASKRVFFRFSFFFENSFYKFSERSWLIHMKFRPICMMKTLFLAPIDQMRFLFKFFSNLFSCRLIFSMKILFLSLALFSLHAKHWTWSANLIIELNGSHGKRRVAYTNYEKRRQNVSQILLNKQTLDHNMNSVWLLWLVFFCFFFYLSLWWIFCYVNSFFFIWFGLVVAFSLKSSFHIIHIDGRSTKDEKPHQYHSEFSVCPVV